MTKEEKLFKPQTIGAGCNNGRSCKPTNEPTDASPSREHDSTTFVYSPVCDSTGVSIEHSGGAGGVGIGSIGSNGNRSSRICRLLLSVGNRTPGTLDCLRLFLYILLYSTITRSSKGEGNTEVTILFCELLLRIRHFELESTLSPFEVQFGTLLILICLRQLGTQSVALLVET